MTGPEVRIADDLDALLLGDNVEPLLAVAGAPCG
jgi:hypothetical protein